MRTYFFRPLAIVAVLAASATVHAQQVAPANRAPAASGMQFVVNLALTGGGDTIEQVEFENGHTRNVHAGGLVQVGGGIYWQAADMPIATQLTLNYHMDNISASNGTKRFDRIPLEATVFYTGLPNWRFGGGVRAALSPKYKSEVDDETDYSVKFKDTVGGIVEVGYAMQANLWLNLRYVAEKYEPSSVTYGGRSAPVVGAEKVDGSHVSLGVSYQF